MARTPKLLRKRGVKRHAESTEPPQPKPEIKREKGGKFAKGQSANPRGRPPGSRNATTIMVEQMLEDQAERLTEALIGRALDGSTHAMDIVFARLAPVRKDRTIEVDLPALKTMQDVVSGYDAVIAAAATGSISVSEAQGLGALLEMKRRAVETAELEKRLASIEERLTAAGGALHA